MIASGDAEEKLVVLVTPNDLADVHLANVITTAGGRADGVTFRQTTEVAARVAVKSLRFYSSNRKCRKE